MQTKTSEHQCFLSCGQLLINNWPEIASRSLMCHTLHNWTDNGWTIFCSYWGNLFETDGSLNKVSLIHALLVFFHKGISFSIWLTMAAVDHQFCLVASLKVEAICTTAFIFTNTFLSLTPNTLLLYSMHLKHFWLQMK